MLHTAILTISGYFLECQGQFEGQGVVKSGSTKYLKVVKLSQDLNVGSEATYSITIQSNLFQYNQSPLSFNQLMHQWNVKEELIEYSTT